jgi:hypothetical protein
METIRIVIAVAFALPFALPRPAASEDARTSTKRTPEEEADYLVQVAEDAVGRHAYRTAKTCLDRVVKVYPDTTAARRARELLKRVPNEHGRLLLGFDEQSELAGSGAEWVTDPKVVPFGKGAARLQLKGRNARFRIPAQKFEAMETVSFWVWAEAPIVGMTGTTYICLYTNNNRDFLQQKFQLRGDATWRLVTLNAGGFKRRTKNTNRTFTAIGFWNPSPEIRNFIVDDIRVKEKLPPKAGSLLNAPTGGGSLPSLNPPR